MVLLKDLAVLVTLASFAACSPLESETFSGAVGVPAAPGNLALPPMTLDPALAPVALPQTPADLPSGQSIISGKKHKAYGIHSNAETQHHQQKENVEQNVAIGSLAVAPAPPKQLAIREVIERGLSNIAARDPPAQSFVQALGNMFSGLAKPKDKRDEVLALPAPGPALANGSSSLPQGNPADSTTHSQAPPPPAPAAGSPPVPVHPADDVSHAQSPPPPVPAGGTPPSPGNLADAIIHPGAPPPAPAPESPPSANDTLSPPPPGVDASKAASGAHAAKMLGAVPESPGAVAQDAHMGHDGGYYQQSALHQPTGHSRDSHHGHRNSGHYAGPQRTSRYGKTKHAMNHHAVSQHGMGRYAVNHASLKPGGRKQFAGLKIQHGGMAGGSKLGSLQSGANLMRYPATGGPVPGIAIQGSAPQLALKRRHYRNSRRAENVAEAPSTKAEEPAKSEEPTKVEKAVKAQEPVKAGEPTKSEKPVKVEEPLKAEEPIGSEKPASGATDSKAAPQKAPADVKPAPKKDQKIGSMSAGLDSSFSMGAAKDPATKEPVPESKKQDAASPKAKGHRGKGKGHQLSKGHHGKGRKSKSSDYKPRPGSHKKNKPAKQAVGEHHSSRYNNKHKMIPQVARRHELVIREAEAAAYADAKAAAYADYLQEREAYAHYLAARDAYAAPES